MNVYFQILVYILIIIGFYLITITFGDNKIINKKYFEINEGEKQNVEIWIVTKNIGMDVKEKIKKILENGDYNSIYDVASNVYIKNKDIDI